MSAARFFPAMHAPSVIEAWSAGDKVVCVDDLGFYNKAPYFSEPIASGRTYCVRAVSPGSVTLAGIDGARGLDGTELGFPRVWFRRVWTAAPGSRLSNSR